MEEIHNPGQQGYFVRYMQETRLGLHMVTSPQLSKNEICEEFGIIPWDLKEDELEEIKPMPFCMRKKLLSAIRRWVKKQNYISLKKEICNWLEDWPKLPDDKRKSPLFPFWRTLSREEERILLLGFYEAYREPPFISLGPDYPVWPDSAKDDLIPENPDPKVITALHAELHITPWIVLVSNLKTELLKGDNEIIWEILENSGVVRGEGRISQNEANTRIREVLSSLSHDQLKTMTTRKMAEMIGCSTGLISKTGIWKGFIEKMGRRRGKSKMPKVVAMTDIVEQEIAFRKNQKNHDEEDTLDALVEEQERDAKADRHPIHRHL